MKWWWQKIALLVIGLAFFLATAAAQRALMPWPAGGGLRTRVLTYLEHQDSFDAIYLGSSRIAHGIDPLIVDPIVSRQIGRPFVSFNLGFNATHGFETDYLIRSLLDDPPERLKFVVIEAQTLSAEMESYSRLVTDRTIAWHTPRYTALALLDLAESERTIRPRGLDATVHLRMFARHMTNAGQGPELVASSTEARSSSFQKESASEMRVRGYSDLKMMSDGSLPPSRQNLLDHLGRYRRARRTFEDLARFAEPRPIAAAILAGQVAFLKSRGLVPIYVMPPTLDPPESYSEFERRGTISDFLSYADPSTYPDLFYVESRWDLQHVSRRGATLWSRRLGDDLGAIFSADHPEQ
jgi:hypothetical protein